MPIQRVTISFRQAAYDSKTSQPIRRHFARMNLGWLSRTCHVAAVIACRRSPSQMLQRTTLLRRLRRYPQSHFLAIARSASGATHHSAAPLNSGAVLKRSDRAASDNVRDWVIARPSKTWHSEIGTDRNNGQPYSGTTQTIVTGPTGPQPAGSDLTKLNKYKAKRILCPKGIRTNSIRCFRRGNGAIQTTSQRSRCEVTAFSLQRSNEFVRMHDSSP